MSQKIATAVFELFYLKAAALIKYFSHIPEIRTGLMDRLPGTKCGNTEFHWGERTYVMGIINTSPESFSGDGLSNRDSLAGWQQKGGPVIDDRAGEIVKAILGDKREGKLDPKLEKELIRMCG